MLYRSPIQYLIGPLFRSSPNSTSLSPIGGLIYIVFRVTDSCIRRGYKAVSYSGAPSNAYRQVLSFRLHNWHIVLLSVSFSSQ